MGPTAGGMDRYPVPSCHIGSVQCRGTYPAVLQILLRESLRDAHVVNFGIKGDSLFPVVQQPGCEETRRPSHSANLTAMVSSSQACLRAVASHPLLSKAVAFQPHVAIVMLGTNDARAYSAHTTCHRDASIAADTARGALIHVVRTLWHIANASLVMLLTPPPLISEAPAQCGEQWAHRSRSQSVRADGTVFDGRQQVPSSPSAHEADSTPCRCVALYQYQPPPNNYSQRTLGECSTCDGDPIIGGGSAAGRRSQPLHLKPKAWDGCIRVDVLQHVRRGYSAAADTLHASGELNWCAGHGLLLVTPPMRADSRFFHGDSVVHTSPLAAAATACHVHQSLRQLTWTTLPLHHADDPTNFPSSHEPAMQVSSSDGSAYCSAVVAFAADFEAQWNATWLSRVRRFEESLARASRQQIAHQTKPVPLAVPVTLNLTIATATDAAHPTARGTSSAARKQEEGETDINILKRLLRGSLRLVRDYTEKQSETAKLLAEKNQEVSLLQSYIAAAEEQGA